MANKFALFTIVYWSGWPISKINVIAYRAISSPVAPRRNDGPIEWLRSYTIDVLMQLLKDGVKNSVLEEIDIA